MKKTKKNKKKRKKTKKNRKKQKKTFSHFFLISSPLVYTLICNRGPLLFPDLAHFFLFYIHFPSPPIHPTSCACESLVVPTDVSKQKGGTTGEAHVWEPGWEGRENGEKNEEKGGQMTEKGGSPGKK